MAEEGVKLSGNAQLDLLDTPNEIELIRHIASLPKEIDLSAKSYDPAKITKQIESRKCPDFLGCFNSPRSSPD